MCSILSIGSGALHLVSWVSVGTGRPGGLTDLVPSAMEVVPAAEQLAYSFAELIVVSIMHRYVQSDIDAESILYTWLQW